MNTSIIMVSFDKFKWQRHITMAALNCIRRFTPKEYEFILVDTSDTDWGKWEGQPYNRYEIIKPDKVLSLGDVGYSAGMNAGVQASNPETKYVVCMHNDVFVQEGWLPVMREYLEKGLCEIIYPDQIARPRETMEAIYKHHRDHNSLHGRDEFPGHDEAGMFMLEKSLYNKFGGYNEKYKNVYQDLMFQRKYRGYRRFCTTKTFITHIGSMGYAYSENAAQKNIDRESKILSEDKE